MRLRSDLKFGTITDNPLAIGATSINSAQFATLPTVAGSDELLLTLDPEGSNREIVKVTAHAAGATVVTAQRGQLGTAAAQHALGTRWVHSFVTTDVLTPCTSSARPTTGLFEGALIYEENTDRIYVHDGSAWKLAVPAGFEQSVYARYVPGANSDTTSATPTWAEWGGSVNITVPSWATRARVVATAIGVFPSGADGSVIELAVSIGSGGSAAFSDGSRVTTFATATTPRLPLTLVKEISSSLPTGTQAIRFQARRVSGAGFFRADTQSDFDFAVDFRP